MLQSLQPRWIRWPLASNNMSKLHCVHLIGRPLRGTAFDSMLVSLLAKHAVVLTLQVDLVVAPMPLQLSLALPNLQHLALMGHKFAFWWTFLPMMDSSQQSMSSQVSRHYICKPRMGGYISSGLIYTNVWI